jgi:hypothetical protein
MLNLQEFYCQIVCQTPPRDRFVTIQELQDVIVINFDCLYERECGIRGADQLVYLAHKLGQGKRFLFLSEDGTLIQQSGASEIIKNIIQCFNLDKDTCAVVCRENLDIPNITIINNEAIPYWCRVLHPHIKDIPIPIGSFIKKFAVWANRGTFIRLDIARYLFENYADESFISYQEQDMLADRKLKEYFSDNIDWANQHTPIIYDEIFPGRQFNFELIVGASRKPYNDYFIEIVAETDTLTTNWITEKTVKNLYIGKPFIVMGGPGLLDKIRSFGFQTFSPWIDESYDTITNNYQRLETIKQEIDRIANKTDVEIHQMHQQLLPIFEHNRKTYRDIFKFI